MSDLTQERLKELLDYDPETGIFTTRGSRGNLAAGNKAGTPNSHGYEKIGIDRKQYRGHRLAWLYVYGYFPKELDHINGIRNDNRIANLREASRVQNSGNKPANRNNTSGKKGVSFHKRTGRWRAVIKKNYRYIHLGSFGSVEEAHAAYVAAARVHFGDFARGE